ncbi:ACP S-malonyltransferase [Aquirufa rosea]|uniref:Malonyl CoA-acyl carrier protein transacylase n=1 Tax=Aquirufa rosea TaxID=2509241 RepID=A0A4Q1BXN1_9BACT|nr:ACP S-malonyltransferase [Aquirufa rosea]RXK47125.1 [acyl-carrier-protein] S-malonyltransferase [Aquirufa rosea]
MKAYVFPGQGSQFPGMAKDLYENFTAAKEIVNEADQILGFSLSKVMFEGTEEDLKQTKVTQPAIYLHSVLVAKLGKDFAPDMVAGHSLGEFSALVAAGALSWQDGLRLVYQRALAMQKACELVPSTMAAVLGLADADIERICGETNGEVVAANYNCPGQVVISGSVAGIEKVAELLKAAGAKRVLTLPVGGAFHSPFMEPARVELAAAIEATTIERPICPIFQNVTAKASQDPAEIKQNLIAQLTGAVRWTQSVEAMVAAGATEFIECGPGKVLQGLVKKISADVQVASMELA